VNKSREAPLELLEVERTTRALELASCEQHRTEKRGHAARRIVKQNVDHLQQGLNGGEGSNPAALIGLESQGISLSASCPHTGGVGFDVDENQFQVSWRRLECKLYLSFSIDVGWDDYNWASEVSLFDFGPYDSGSVQWPSFISSIAGTVSSVVDTVGDCLSESDSDPKAFIMCLAKPIFNALTGSGLIGGSSVSEAVPFPGDELDQVFDVSKNSMVEVAHCPDCVETDLRDYESQSCVDYGFDVAFAKLSFTGCNVPFFPGKGDGFNLKQMVVDKAKSCTEKALLWQADGVMDKISSIAFSAFPQAESTLDTLTGLLSSSRALMASPNITDAGKQLASDAKQQLSLAMRTCKSLKEVGQQLKSSLLNLKPPYKASAAEIMSNFEELSRAALDCGSTVKQTLQQVSEDQGDAGEAYNRFRQSAKDTMALLEGATAPIFQQLEEGFKDLDAGAVLGETLDALKSIDLGDVKDFLTKCALGREAYMKAYVQVALLGVPIARLSMHERDGISFAHYDIENEKKVVVTHKYSWHEVAQHPSFTLCAPNDVICGTVKIGLQGVPDNIMGVQLPETLSSLDLGDVKFLEISFQSFKVQLDQVGIPVPDFDADFDETDLIIPFIVQHTVHTCVGHQCGDNVAKADGSSIICAGEHGCTDAECCNPLCSGYTCGHGWLVKEGTITCTGTSCSNAECCYTTTTTTTSTTRESTWAVQSGDCKVASNCIQSPNYPDAYGDSQECSFTSGSGMEVSATGFNTESGYDRLTLNGVTYEGTAGPSGIEPHGTITWSSDGSVTQSGWELCAHIKGYSVAPGGYCSSSHDCNCGWCNDNDSKCYEACYDTTDGRNANHIPRKDVYFCDYGSSTSSHACTF